MLSQFWTDWIWPLIQSKIKHEKLIRSYDQLDQITGVFKLLTRSPPIVWVRQNAAPLKFDPKPSEAAFSPFLGETT